MRLTLRCSLYLLTGAAICFLNAVTTSAQVTSLAQSTVDQPALIKLTSGRPPSARTAKDGPKDESTRLTALEDALRQQLAQLEELRKLMLEQQETIKVLTGKLAGASGTPSREEVPAVVNAVPAAGGSTIAADSQTPSVDDRLKKVESRISELGAIKFSG